MNESKTRDQTMLMCSIPENIKDNQEQLKS